MPGGVGELRRGGARFIRWGGWGEGVAGSGAANGVRDSVVRRTVSAAARWFHDITVYGSRGFSRAGAGGWNAPVRGRGRRGYWPNSAAMPSMTGKAANVVMNTVSRATMVPLP